MQLSKKYLFGPMTYEPLNDRAFIDARDEANLNSTRVASGWIIYQRTAKGLTVSRGQGRCLTLSQMIDRLLPKPQLTPKRIHRTQTVTQPVPGPEPSR